jgi:hypothetical protein
MNTNGTSALQIIQEPTPVLAIVEKPVVIVTPALKISFVTSSGHEFEALHYGLDYRVFQSQLNAVCYHMEVKQTSNEHGQLTLESYINGRFISSSVPKISVYYAMRYGALGYVSTMQQAIECKYEHLQSLVMSGKA